MQSAGSSRDLNQADHEIDTVAELMQDLLDIAKESRQRGHARNQQLHQLHVRKRYAECLVRDAAQVSN